MLKFGTQKSKAANAISMTALLFSMSVDILTQDMLPHRLCTVYQKCRRENLSLI